MDFFITCDVNWETKVDKTRDAIIDITGYEAFFKKRSYGNSIFGICVVLMCRNPSLNFKQRIRYLKEKRQIYFDIMLDYDVFVHAEQNDRNTLAARKLIEEIPLIIAKYKFEDFDLKKFQTDLTKCLRSLL